jgi:hypothetical protein
MPKWWTELEGNNGIVIERLFAGPFLLTKESGKLASGWLSVSASLAHIAPDSWTIDWGGVDEAERLARAAEFGIDAQRLPDAIRWATEHFDGGGFAWPNVFLNAAAARDFHRRFVTASVRLLQMSLPEQNLESFLALTTPTQQPPGYAPIGTIGVHAALAQRSVLTEVTQRRGYEVLGFDGGAGFDSFRSHGLEDDFERLFGIRFNRWGLIDDGSAAARCAELANGPEVSTCAVAWHPWLLSEHAL